MENLECRPGWDEAAAHTLIALCRSGQASLHTLGKGGLWPAAAKPRADHPASDVAALFLAGFEVLFRLADEGRLGDIVKGYRSAGHEAEGPGGRDIVSPRRRAILRCRKSFRTGCMWILPRLSQLRSTGWSLRDLFGVDKCTPPWGSWGLAWSSVWVRASEIILEDNGAVCFRICEAGRTVEQRARPP
jgi:hypothetical protein